jgi:small subunit ribosomal protein S5
VLTKSIGTQNPINLVKATMEGLYSLRRPEDVAELRGISVREVLGVGNGAAAESDETPKEETPKEVAAPAAEADSKGVGTESAEGEDAAIDGEAEAPAAGSDGEAAPANAPEEKS